jgi:hypothetical protein
MGIMKYENLPVGRRSVAILKRWLKASLLNPTMAVAHHIHTDPEISEWLAL